MTLNEIANELVAGCREGRSAANLEKLYATDAISVEALDNGNGRSMQGIDAIKGKHDWWEANFEMISASVSDPMPHGDDRFAVIFEMQAKNKESGEIADMKEVALYQVGAGKIVREEFFYGA